MSDNVALTNTQGGGSGQKQDPLAVLESILSEAKQKGQSVNPQAHGLTTALGQGAAVGLTPEEIKQQEEEKRRQAELERQRQAQLEAERLRQIELQKRRLEEELRQTPQYQARMQQEAEKKEKLQKQQSAGEGYEIRQLGHTKI